MRYSTEQQQSVLMEQEKSGLNISQYCKQKGLSDKLVYKWRKRRLEPLGGNFAQVITEPRREKITIRLSDGIELQVPVNLLKTVLQELSNK